MNASYGDFRAAAEPVSFSEMQLVVRSDERGETLVVKVETVDRSDAASVALREALLRGVRKLADGLDERSLVALEIELLAPGTLPRNPRSGKIKNVVDERR
jgi:phenylacetate-coenzyme A ligase PaaK-like adenylate-forming protein